MTTPSAPVALTIAGSDSSGGAGIQADLKTFCAFGVYGASAITALTAQNTCGVTGVLPTPPEFIASQIEAVATDLHIGAVKTGMLATRDVVLAVCGAIRRHKLSLLVVDPVMVATSGDALLDPDAVEAIQTGLFPLAHLITPNLQEAARLLDGPLTNSSAGMADQARTLQTRFGIPNVLIKGGHGEGDAAIDILLEGATVHTLALPRLTARNTHGTGCTLSAAITALLALGVPLHEAVARAKRYVWNAITAGEPLRIGHGAGPLDHLYAIRRHDPPA
jgi:hydroxymethylpyrimidine/phosphomethylpyrimidine kinase